MRSACASVGPCTLQWLHAMGQLASQPSRTSSITSNHTKQAKRLLRLVRYALANHKPLPDTSADQPTSFLPVPSAAHAQPTRSELHTAQTGLHDTASLSQATHPVSYLLEDPKHTAKVPRDLGHDLQATQKPTCDREVSQAPEASSAALCAHVQSHALQGGQQPTQQHHPQHAASASQVPDSLSGVVYLIETCIPWETLALSSCHAPCPFQFSLTAATWAHDSAEQSDAQCSSAHPLTPPAYPQSSAAQESAAGPLANPQALAQHPGASLSAAQHSKAQPALADGSSLREAARNQSQRDLAHAAPIGDRPVDDTTWCLEAEHGVKQAVQQVLQGCAALQELHFSSSVKARLIRLLTSTAVAW